VRDRPRSRHTSRYKRPRKRAPRPHPVRGANQISRRFCERINYHRSHRPGVLPNLHRQIKERCDHPKRRQQLRHRADRFQIHRPDLADRPKFRIKKVRAEAAVCDGRNQLLITFHSSLPWAAPARYSPRHKPRPRQPRNSRPILSAQFCPACRRRCDDN
jgi:hypothetical protein